MTSTVMLDSCFLVSTHKSLEILKVYHTLGSPLAWPFFCLAASSFPASEEVKYQFLQPGDWERPLAMTGYFSTQALLHGLHCMLPILASIVLLQTVLGWLLFLSYQFMAVEAMIQGPFRSIWIISISNAFVAV